MSEILKFIIDNFSSLRPLDYLLIVFCLVILTTGIFFIFRWLFVSRFSAQAELVEIKEKIIGSLQTQLSMTEKASLEAQKEVNDFKARIDDLEAKYAERLRKDEQSKELTKQLLGFAFNAQMSIFTASFFLLAYARLVQIYRLLFLYTYLNLEKSFPDAPSPNDIFKRIDNIANRLYDADSAFEVYFKDDGLDVSTRVNVMALKEQFTPDSLFQEIRAIQDTLTPSLDHVLELVQKHKG